MKVKLTVSRGGPDGTFAPGEEIDVSDAEAQRMFDAGQAIPVRSEKPETATRKDKSEKAVK
ncbi:hypothetical protein GGE07_002480 [Sinorhizobium terangae]|uniref:Uncharacterized protein n=1 Tax=Sinorhizobium terangae TaxID=110322 RepID=A0A6N7LSZ0_SINTE|nr:hypothetical protein [Sinorhizobium terangae]MBB4185830.1 hypothetical protein [Sinorhizobium terangae]MQX19375.1 hypothetical protein [Sinorhizobium terangae]